MKNKSYIAPATKVVQLSLHVMVIQSDNTVTVTLSNGNEGEADDPNASRQSGLWDDDDY